MNTKKNKKKLSKSVYLT